MIGPKKLASLSRPIRCKTKINHGLVARIFLPFGRFACFYSEFSLAFQGIFHSSFHNKYFGFVLRHSIEKRSINGNPKFPSPDGIKIHLLNVEILQTCSFFSITYSICCLTLHDHRHHFLKNNIKLITF